MAVSSYKSRTPPAVNLRIFIGQENRKIEVSISSIVELLQALNVPIEIGANDSGGSGYRVLRIPNA
jgi:hypothetical protein